MGGSLSPFDTVSGTIIAILRSSKGTEDAAFTAAVAPVTHIDGDKLIDLKIEHSFGVRKRIEVAPENRTGR